MSAFPHFLIGDGHHFVQAYFTADAIKEFRKNYSSMKVTDLNDKIVTLNTWSLELIKVNSNSNFTSYADIEVRLVVNSFQVNKDGKYQARYQTNLFRDDDIKTLLLKYRHAIFVQNATGNAEEFPDVTKSSAKKIDAKAVVAQKKNDFAPASGTKVVDLKDVFIEEKGQAAYTSWVRGGDKKVTGKKSAPKKSVGKRSGRTLAVGGATPAAGTGSVVRKAIGKILNRKRDQKTTPSRAAAKAKMTLSDYKKYLDWYVDQDGKKSGGRASRAGKASSASRRSTRK